MPYPNLRRCLSSFAWWGGWTAISRLLDACGTFQHAKIAFEVERKRAEVPSVRLVLDEDAAGLTALELVKALQEGRPRIAANPTFVHEGVVVFGPTCLRGGEPEQVAQRLNELLG